MVRFILGYIIVPLIVGMLIGAALQVNAEEFKSLTVQRKRVGPKDNVIHVRGIMQAPENRSILLVVACGMELIFTFHNHYGQTPEFERRVVGEIEEACK